MISHQRSSPTILFTLDGYTRVQKEYDEYVKKRPEAVEQLKKSREMGDLSENGYYKASRAKLSQIDARIRHLKKLLLFGKVINTKPSDHVVMGSTVTLSHGAKHVIYQIVGEYEANPSEKRISYRSPLGEALLGKHVDETVHVSTPNGIATYTIQSVV